MLLIRLSEQRLYHRRHGRWCSYPISGSRYGTGCERGSFKTPLGKHRICEKIGTGLPMRTAFAARKPVGIYRPGVDDPGKDWILTRILRLSGCELGRNLRGKVDTKRRFIYIHGTHAEERIGSPASHGCIRMRNRDILALFERVRIGERVRILP